MLVNSHMCGPLQWYKSLLQLWILCIELVKQHLDRSWEMRRHSRRSQTRGPGGLTKSWLHNRIPLWQHRMTAQITVGLVWPFPFAVRFWSIFDWKPLFRFSSVRFQYVNCDIYLKPTITQHRWHFYCIAGCALAAASVSATCCVVQNELARYISVIQVTGPAVCMLIHTLLTPHPGSTLYNWVSASDGARYENSWTEANLCLCLCLWKVNNSVIPIR